MTLPAGDTTGVREALEHNTKIDTRPADSATGMLGLTPKAPNALKSDLKKPRICPIWGQSDPLWSQTYQPCNRSSYLCEV